MTSIMMPNIMCVRACVRVLMMIRGTMAVANY